MMRMNMKGPFRTQVDERREEKSRKKRRDRRHAGYEGEQAAPRATT